MPSTAKLGSVSQPYTGGSEGKHSASLMRGDLEGMSQDWGWRQHARTLIPIVGVFLVLAFYGIDRQSLWEDEYNSLWRVTASKYPIWKDGHGFLYFALLNVWINFGTSELVLRSLSVLLGALAVCLTYAVGFALMSRRAAVYATVILATSPLVIWYSQEVRYVTLTLAATLLSMYTFQRLLNRPSFSRLFAYGSANLIAFFSFVPTLVLPMIQVLYLVSSPSRRPLLWKWTVCQLVVLVVFAWWFVNGTHFLPAIMQARDSGQSVIANPEVFPFTGDFNEVRLAVIPYTFFAFSAGFSLGPSPRELYSDRKLARLAPYTPMLITLGLLYGGLLLSGLITTHRQGDSWILLGLWMSIPILGVFGIASMLDVYYDVRYVAAAFPAYIFLLTAGIIRMKKRGAQMLLLGAVLAVHGAALANYYFEPRYAREDIRAAVKYLETAAGPRDVFLIVGTESSLPHYYKGNLPLVDFRTLQPAGQPLKDKLRKLSTNHDRIWLLQIRPWQVDRSGAIKAELDSNYPLAEQQHFSGLDLYSYQISP